MKKAFRAILSVVGSMIVVVFSVSGQGMGNPDDRIRLFEAIRSGRTDKMLVALRNGANVNDTLLGYSALMAAALNGSAEDMRILIEGGADVNYMSPDSLTALWFALPDMEKISLLLDHGASIAVKAKRGMTLLKKLASIPGSGAAIRLFVSRGADLPASNPGNELIFRAAVAGDTSTLSTLLQMGLHADDTSMTGNKPIILAGLFQNLPTISMLLGHGADINAVSRARHMTVLMTASRIGDEETVNYLLGHGADVRVVASDGYTALIFWGLSETDRPDITGAMSAGMGKEVLHKAKDGADAMFWAGKKGQTASVKVLYRYMVH